MKRIKKQMVLVAMLTFAMFLVGATASFATVCNNVSVEQVGAKSNSNAVFVKKTATSSTCPGVPAAGLWIVMDPANADAMLATALTALSLGNVMTIVNAAGDFVNQGTVIEVYVGK